MQKMSVLLCMVATVPTALAFFSPLATMGKHYEPRRVLALRRPSYLRAASLCMQTKRAPSEDSDNGRVDGGQEGKKKIWQTDSAEEEPSGGWAPPPWKRKISNAIKTLKPGQKLKGKVRNVEDFGAFVDVGAERDGIVHISEISTEFIYSPHDVLRSGKEVDAWVKWVDAKSNKLILTLIETSAETLSEGLEIERFDASVGTEMPGRVTRITNFGAYLDIGCEVEAFLHCTQLPKLKGSNSRMSLQDLVVGRDLPIRVLEVNVGLRRISVTARSKDDVNEERQRFAAPERPTDAWKRGPKPPST